MKLALGTVQFGLNYGISARGQVPLEEVDAILALAQASGLDTLDTAIAYGASEAVLGEVGVSRWKVISKLPPELPRPGEIAQWAEAHLQQSLQRLRITGLEGLLLHRPEYLLVPGGETLAMALREMKHSGLVKKIGFSIYSPEELTALCEVMRPDIVQCPYSIFDRRIETSGWLGRLHADGVEVHARSLFLQGALLMAPEQRPAHFGKWTALFDAFSDWVEREGMTRLEACLKFVIANPAISKAVVGVDSVDHLREIVAASRGKVGEFPTLLQTEDLDLLLPGRWQ